MRPIDLQPRGARSVSPLELGLVELPTRPRSEYTMGVRKGALESADQGLLREAADITRAAMTESGYARGILSDLTNGLWGLPRSFVGNAEMIADLDDTPERVGQWRQMFPEPDAIRLMAWGITLGVGLGQMRPRYGKPGDAYPVSLEEAADGSWRLPQERPIGAHYTRTLRTWDPKYLRNQWWDESWFLITADGEIRIDPNEGEWMLYLPFGEIKPWEYGAWRALTLAYILQRDALFDRSRHAEVLAPIRVGQVPQGTTERQRLKYLDLIRRTQRMGVFVLPPGLEYKIVESSGRIADIYDKIIAWANADYAMITGAVTTAEGNKGFARGDVQERFTRSILSSFGSSLSSCLHAGGLVPWSIENYGTPDAPRVEFDTAAPEDKRARAETVKTAAEGLSAMSDALAKHNKRLSASTVERYLQGLGFETEGIPARTNLPRIDVTPTAREFAYTLDEIRAGDGYDPIGDERGDLTIAEAEAVAKKKAVEGDGVVPPDAVDDGPVPAMGDAPPTDEAAASLAAKMTEHGIARCEHGSCNRCRLCGVERVRDFDRGRDGAPMWKVAWRPIVRAVPAPILNGSSHPPLFSPGGDA